MHFALLFLPKTNKGNCLDRNSRKLGILVSLIGNSKNFEEPLTQKMIFFAKTESETIALGKTLGTFLQAGDVIALSGTLGAGKTTLTKGIASALNVTEEITSPTFCLISEYEGNLPLYHFDVYRLNGSDDFVNLGADDMIYGNGVSIIEWSEKIKSELPENAISILLEVVEIASHTGSQCDGEQVGTDVQISGQGGGAQSSVRKITVSNWPYKEFTFGEK